MSRVPFSDEETRVIFGKGTLSDLAECDGQTQEQLLKRLVTICENVSPPDHFIYETIKNLDIIRAGDTCRLYTKVVTNIPEGNTEYHVIFVLYIDADHDYDQSDLTRFSKQAQADLDEITNLETVPDVKEYLEDHDAMDVSDLQELLDQ